MLNPSELEAALKLTDVIERFTASVFVTAYAIGYHDGAHDGRLPTPQIEARAHAAYAEVQAYVKEGFAEGVAQFQARTAANPNVS